MKKIFITTGYLFVTCITIGQAISKEYDALINKGRLFYQSKDYLNAAATFSSAVRLGGDKTSAADRSRAAFSWALAGVPDSAFYFLDMIAEMERLVFMN